MSNPARISLLLLFVGFVLLFIEWRAAIIVMGLSVLPLQWAAYRRKQAKLKKLKELRDDLQEQNWLKKSGWFTKKGIT